MITDKITDEHAFDVCKIGLRAQCCRYLTMGADGWSCQKAGPLRETIDKKVEAGTFVAQGDNCEGRAS